MKGPKQLLNRAEKPLSVILGTPRGLGDIPGWKKAKIKPTFKKGKKNKRWKRLARAVVESSPGGFKRYAWGHVVSLRGDLAVLG